MKQIIFLLSDLEIDTFYFATKHPNTSKIETIIIIIKYLSQTGHLNEIVNIYKQKRNNYFDKRFI